MEFDQLDVSAFQSGSLQTLKGIRTRSMRIVFSKPDRLEALKEVRFKLLILANGFNLPDFAPLRQCLEMEELDVNQCSASIEPLRGHPTLKRLAYSRPGEPDCPMMPVEKFWAEYDAKKAAGK